MQHINVQRSTFRYVCRNATWLPSLCILSGLIGVSCFPQPEPPNVPPVPTWDVSKYPWPMFGQNVRRTGQSPFDGPSTATPGSAKNWAYDVVGGAVVNMQAVVSDAGVYFGAWGVLRRDAALQPDTWDKSDGRWYGLKLATAEAGQSQDLFAPMLPAITPAGYLKSGRTKLSRDVFWVGDGNDFLVSFYNGTIEGTPVIDPDDGTHYVGRGDGRLYAIDPASGAVKWTFTTFNPEDPGDPDGGGEIVGGPLMGPDEILYFGTLGAPWPGDAGSNPPYETHAVYAVDTSGQLVWRYPSQATRLSNWVLTPPALSGDGQTLYVGTFAGDVTQVGKLMAFDLGQPADASDEDRLKWELELQNPERILHPNLYVRAIAVGADGRVYCAGNELHFLGTSPAVFAVDDERDAGEFVWVTEPQGYPSTTGQFCAGLALHEVDGEVRTLFTSTTHAGRTNGDGGALFAVDPSNGDVRHSFDPGTRTPPGVGGMTAPTLGANGTVYVGVRGKNPVGATAAVNGRMYALSYDRNAGFTALWDYEIQGQLDWVPPAIGANGGLYFGSSAPFDSGFEIQWFTPTETPPDRTPRFYAIFE